MQNKLSKAPLITVIIAAFGLAAHAQQVAVKSVGSVLKGSETQVTVQFTKPVEAASGTAVGNYTIPGVTVTAAALMTGLPDPALPGNPENSPPSGRAENNQVVVLTVTGLTAGTTNRITVRNVRDREVNPTTLTETNINFVASSYKWTDIGAPSGTASGRVVALSDDGFDIYSGGRAQWANYDEVTIVYKEVTGDFDVKARVEFQDFSSRWARAGLMVREDLNEGQNAAAQATAASRYASAHANPVRAFSDSGAGLVAGNNGFESHVRTEAGAATGSANAAGGVPEYPNTWVRLQRVGDALTTFRGTNGIDWEMMAERDLAGWNAKLFVGPSFGPETGNINAANGEARDRRYLYQVRFKALSVPFVKSFASSPVGFQLELQDATTTVNTNSIRVTFDGSPITPPISSSGGITTISHTTSVFQPGSSHTLTLVFSDSAGASQTITRTFVVGQFITIPTSFEVGSLVDKTKPGFKVRVHQVETAQPNTLARTEAQLAGELGPNVAELSQAVNGIFIDQDVINYDQDGADQGNFRPDEQMPGIPGGGGTDNIAMEILTFVEFPAPGLYTMGVNSDDGFRTSTGIDFRDRFQTGTVILGQFDGGRGAADTTFQFYVEKAGIYPFRTIWEEGGGGANIEWFTVTASGTKVLLNDRGTAGHLKAYHQGALPAGGVIVKSTQPAPGSITATETNAVVIVLQNGSTQVVPNSVRLMFDTNDVTSTTTVTTAGNDVTVRFTPAAMALGSQHTVTLVFGESTTPASSRTNVFTFSVRTPLPADLPSNSFVIEAEDFDFDSGKSKPEASVMPYLGGAYQDLSAVINVDFRNADGEDSNAYREPALPVNITASTGLRLSEERPGYQVTVNYRIGWIGDEWHNYTRTIPNGLYKVYAALSFDGTAPGQLAATLQKVTAGAGTANQTLVQLGAFNQAGSGGWGQNNLVPMKAPDGSDAVVKLGGVTTLRYTSTSGDFDWFVLAPVTGVPPKVIASTPNPGGTAKRNTELNFTISDLSTAVVPSTIRLLFDGADVTGQATITDTADGATVRFIPGGLLEAGSQHTYALTYSDNATPAVSQTFTGTFTVGPLGGPGVFVIEAEDFDFDGGKHIAAASTMPYFGGSYSNLSAVHDVDYHQPGNEPSSDLYRLTEEPNVPITPQGDTDRGTYVATINHRIGWTDNTDWYNYTRVFPAGNYEVHAALSFDGTAPSQLAGSLQRVTAGAGTANQTLEQLGAFDAPGSGGWGRNNLVPLKQGGNNAVVALGGTNTIRFSAGSGDVDYYVFVPAGAAGPRLTIRKSGANVIIEWGGAGALESAPNVTGPWNPVAGASSPATRPITGDRQFYRVRQP